MCISWMFKVFISFIVVMNPFGMLPLFLELTQFNTKLEKQYMVKKACTVALTVLIICALFGRSFFRTISVPTYAFKIFGGIVLLLASIDMIVVKRSRFTNPTSDEKREANRQADISIFPLAVPLMAGPGAFSNIIVQAELAQSKIELLFIILILSFTIHIIYLSLMFADEITKFVGITISNTFVRVCGIIVGGIATNSILIGIEGFISKIR